MASTKPSVVFVSLREDHRSSRRCPLGWSNTQVTVVVFLGIPLVAGFLNQDAGRTRPRPGVVRVAAAAAHRPDRLVRSAVHRGGAVARYRSRAGPMPLAAGWALGVAGVVCYMRPVRLAVICALTADEAARLARRC